MIDRDELAAWLRLLQTPRLGRARARALMSRLGPPQAVFAAPPSEWRQVVDTPTAQALARIPESMAWLLPATLAWLGEPGRRIVTLGDPLYPRLLLEAPDPP